MEPAEVSESKKETQINKATKTTDCKTTLWCGCIDSKTKTHASNQRSSEIKSEEERWNYLTEAKTRNQTQEGKNRKLNKVLY